MITSGHISACVNSFDQFRRFWAGLTTLLSRCQERVSWPEMVHNDTIWAAIARYLHLSPHLTQRNSFCSILKNWVWIGYLRSFDDKDMHILNNSASNDQGCPHLVNGEQVWSRIWSMNGLFHYEAEVWVLGLRYQVMACMSLWGKIEQIWWLNLICACITSFDQYWQFRWGLIKLLSRCHVSAKVARNGPQW